MVEIRECDFRVGPSDWDSSEFCLLDIEAVKVAAPANWPQKQRFQPVMVGLGHWLGNGIFRVTIGASDDEAELMAWLDEALDGIRLVGFAATRDFDRMVLEGRWVNARRAHATEPGDWPHLTADVEWLNLRKQLPQEPVLPRPADDRPSKEVLTAWPAGDREWVWNHNLADIREMQLGLPESGQ